jgi:phytoene dehydrogenase-like protein
MVNTSIFHSPWQVFSNIEEYAPGFTDSIIGMEVLTPPDLEEIFELTGGVSLA